MKKRNEQIEICLCYDSASLIYSNVFARDFGFIGAKSSSLVLSSLPLLASSCSPLGVWTSSGLVSLKKSLFPARTEDQINCIYLKWHEYKDTVASNTHKDTHHNWDTIHIYSLQTESSITYFILTVARDAVKDSAGTYSCATTWILPHLEQG